MFGTRVHLPAEGRLYHLSGVSCLSESIFHETSAKGAKHVIFEVFANVRGILGKHPQIFIYESLKRYPVGLAGVYQQGDDVGQHQSDAIFKQSSQEFSMLLRLLSRKSRVVYADIN